MTEAEALKVLARQEKKFKEAGFGRGNLLAKSAHDYYDALRDWRKKSDAIAKEYADAKKKLAAMTAEAKERETKARKLLEEARRLKSAAVKYKKIAKNGDILASRERVAQRRFIEKVDFLSKMEVG